MSVWTVEIMQCIFTGHRKTEQNLTSTFNVIIQLQLNNDISETICPIYKQASIFNNKQSNVTLTFKVRDQYDNAVGF